MTDSPLDETPPVTPPSPRRPPPIPLSRRTIWMATSAGLAVMALGIWLVATKLPDLLQSGSGTGPSATGGLSTDARRIQATLFYVSDDGAELVGVLRDAAYGATRSEQARRIVEAQVASPPPGRRTAIPEGTTVRNVYLTANGDAFVDLGGTIVSGHTGGSLDEALAVYAIVNALTMNLPDVTSVQILVEGKQVDTLRGHVDLRSPLGKAPDWIQKGS